jgi:MFS family permease
MIKFKKNNQTKNERSQFSFSLINILFGLLNLYITTKFLESWQLNQFLFFLILGSLISIFYNRISLTFTRFYASSFNKIDRENTDYLLRIRKSSEIYLFCFGIIYAIIFLTFLNLSELFNVHIFENLTIALLIIFSFFFRSSYIFFQGVNKNYVSNYAQSLSLIFVSCLVLLSIFYFHSISISSFQSCHCV